MDYIPLMACPECGCTNLEFDFESLKFVKTNYRYLKIATDCRSCQYRFWEIYEYKGLTDE